MSDPVTTNSVIPTHSPPPSFEAEGHSFSATVLPSNDQVVSGSAAASVASSSCRPPRSPGSMPSTISKAPPSVSGSRLTATSPPTTVSGGPVRNTANGAGPPPSGASTSTATSSSLSPGLPPPRPQGPSSPVHVAEARAALMASMSNMLDNELQSRASVLHANAAALSRQEQDVIRATDALRKENDKLARVARDASRKVKELGNVQNWAEVLERDFLVLEETMRLVRGGGSGDGAESDDGSGSDWSSSYWSGSESDREHDADADIGRGDVSTEQNPNKDDASKKTQETIRSANKGKGKGIFFSGGGFTIGPSNPSPTVGDSGPKDIPNPTHPTVSLDEDILDSLAEALATDLHTGIDIR